MRLFQVQYTTDRLSAEQLADAIACGLFCNSIAGEWKLIRIGHIINIDKSFPTPEQYIKEFVGLEYLTQRGIVFQDSIGMSAMASLSPAINKAFTTGDIRPVTILSKSTIEFPFLLSHRLTNIERSDDIVLW